MTPPTSPAGRRALLLAAIEDASKVVAPLWPLETFIAVNPLWDLRDLPFDLAIRRIADLVGAGGYPPPRMFADAVRAGRLNSDDLRAALDRHQTKGEASTPRPARGVTLGSEVANREVCKWAAVYAGGGMPDAGSGFYPAWRVVVSHDPGARRAVGRDGRRRLALLPDRADDALIHCLEHLGIDHSDWAGSLAWHLAQLPGWSGHAKWRTRWAAPDHPGPALGLVDLLAVKLAYLTELGRAPKRRLPKRSRSRGDMTTSDPIRIEGLTADVAERLGALDPAEMPEVWLDAYEGHFRDGLLSDLERPAGSPPGPPDAQMVCCIDVRSEGLRRHLESQGPYQTYGFAGFFGLPMRFHPFGTPAVDLCPVLVKPVVETREDGAPEAQRALRRELGRRRAGEAAAKVFDDTRESPVAPFVLAEAVGMVAGPVLLARTVAPASARAVTGRVRRLLSEPPQTYVDVRPEAGAMSDEEQALFAETALTTMGLTGDFAPLVVLCGHGSTTTNNPYASALDCGACGGNRGGNSARAAAAILNRPEVRDLLAMRGIEISDRTWFVAAEHDTATDRVEILDPHLVPVAHSALLSRFQDDLRRAGRALAEERTRSLPGAGATDAVRQVATRSADWAEVQPEWGLAGNACFIVGPRSVTRGVDLAGRAFLHSYDHRCDPDGSALETILTAPMVVAHWINAQYYFSTVDPDRYSAGDKTVHNIVAGIGVVSGAGGDLRVGLPLQSLFAGSQARHEPVRLLTVVHAPLPVIEAVIARNEVLRQLFDGRWVHLAARPAAGEPWQLRHPGGAWNLWTPAGPRYSEEERDG